MFYYYGTVTYTVFHEFINNAWTPIAFGSELAAPIQRAFKGIYYIPLVLMSACHM